MQHLLDNYTHDCGTRFIGMGLQLSGLVFVDDRPAASWNEGCRRPPRPWRIHRALKAFGFTFDGIVRVEVNRYGRQFHLNRRLQRFLEL